MDQPHQNDAVLADALDQDTVCLAKTGLEKTQVPDGYVLFEPGTEKVHYLNPTAAIIFEMSDGTKSIGDIAGFIHQAYELNAVPMADTLACTQTLIDQGLIQACSK